MKKAIFLVLCTVVSLTAAAQGQINTKQFVISDFKEKTMKVVLTGNELHDAAFRDNMEIIWHLGAFEFCTEEEFERDKTNPNFYFMIAADSKRRKEEEHGIKVIGIYKGTAGAADLGALYKVVTIPFCSAEMPDGREIAFIPALVTILQNELEDTMNRKINITDSVQPGMRNTFKKWEKRCAIADIDFAEKPTESMISTYRSENIDVVDEDTIEEYLTQRKEDIMVGYVVAPTEPEKNSYCYTMIIDAATWDLFFLYKHKITVKDPVGFTKYNCQFITAHNK